MWNSQLGCGASTFVRGPPCISSPLGKKLGFTIDNGKLHNVSLGQGQEVVAENALDVAAEMGHWVILQVRRRPSGAGAPHPEAAAGTGPKPRKKAGHGVRAHNRGRGQAAPRTLGLGPRTPKETLFTKHPSGQQHPSSSSFGGSKSGLGALCPHFG